MAEPALPGDGAGATEPVVLPGEPEAAEIFVTRLAAAEVAACCRRSPDKETDNEDTLALIPLGPETAVLAVADGAGGLPAGRRASQTAIRTVIGSLAAPRDPSVILRTAILNAMEEANAAVMDLGNGSATTLTIVSVEGRLVRPYHVGDSAALVTGQRGLLKMQTIAHTPVAFAVEAGFLDEVEALYHAERNLVFNFLGTPQMRIEVGAEFELAARDTVLLASDGLTDNLHLAEIIEIARKGSVPAAISDLAAAARERMLTPQAGTPSKPDDLSIILLRKPNGAAPAGPGADDEGTDG